jgi:hypothetical protein
MSPDWSALPEDVPYADMTDPQSLNLYSYVRNNPTSLQDADGHHEVCTQTGWYDQTTSTYHVDLKCHDEAGGAPLE